MPANGRWDLIRRLKVNIILSNLKRICNQAESNGIHMTVKMTNFVTFLKPGSYDSINRQ
jgi:hypothetical protein